MSYFDNIDIEDDLVEGADFYIEKGYRVMTKEHHINRGCCCGNGCRHCPYFPKAQKGNRTLQ